MPYSVTFWGFSNHENGRLKPAWLLALSKNVTIPLREVLHFHVSDDQIRKTTLPFFHLSYRPLELTALGAAEPEPRIDPFGEVV